MFYFNSIVNKKKMMLLSSPDPPLTLISMHSNKRLISIQISIRAFLRFPLLALF